LSIPPRCFGIERGVGETALRENEQIKDALIVFST
jgi:hypothetical protein